MPNLFIIIYLNNLLLYIKIKKNLYLGYILDIWILKKNIYIKTFYYLDKKLFYKIFILKIRKLKLLNNSFNWN